MTATLEGRAMIDDAPTFPRRLRPIEIEPIAFKGSGQQLRSTVKHLLADAKIDDTDNLADEDEPIKFRIHSAVGRFGVAVEMDIEAIGECVDDGRDQIGMGYFADADAFRTDCDEELIAFASKNGARSALAKHCNVIRPKLSSAAVGPKPPDNSNIAERKAALWSDFLGPEGR